MNRTNPPGPTSSRRVALVYARKSIVKTKRDEISPERQVTMCTEAAKVHGWIVETYVDAEGHRSGGSEKHRPEWRRLKAQLSGPDVATVVVGDISGASRSPRDFYNFLDECDRRGVQFISLKEGIDTTTAQGRVMLGICLILAAFEREIASERATVAIGFKREQGKHIGLAPFGTRRDEDGILVEGEDWPTCQVLLEAYATGSYSYLALAMYLNARGLRFRNRERELAPFSRDAVRSVVNNTLVYAGYVLRHKGRHIDLRVDLGNGDVVQALGEHTNAIQGKHKPLISRDLAARIIHARQKSIQRRENLERRVFILYPILHCADCGMQMRALTLVGKSKYIHHGKACWRYSPAIEAGALEQRVLGRMRALRLSPEQRAEVKRRIAERLREVPEHVEVLAAVRNIESKAERLKTLYVEGDISNEQYDQQKRVCNNSLAELRAKLGPRTANLDTVFEQLDSIADILVHGTPQQQRRAIADLFDRIDVDLSGNITGFVPRDWARLVFPMASMPTERIAQ